MLAAAWMSAVQHEAITLPKGKDQGQRKLLSHASVRVFQPSIEIAFMEDVDAISPFRFHESPTKVQKLQIG